jgi:SAM-dependent methyltransferase
VGIRPNLQSLLIRDQLCGTFEGVDDRPTEEARGIHTYGVNIERGRIPCADELYDVVLLTEVLEHLLDPSPALAEINRVLKTGGYIFCSILNAFALHKVVAPLV